MELLDDTGLQGEIYLFSGDGDVSNDFYGPALHGCSRILLY
jgi:hypothetical protein